MQENQVRNIKEFWLVCQGVFYNRATARAFILWPTTWLMDEHVKKRSGVGSRRSFYHIKAEPDA
jgi:hypothetical protein